MLDEPEIVHTHAQRTAVIRLTVPRQEVQKVIGPGLRELMATVAEQGITPAGPWFTHHLRNPSEVFDFEIGVPVDAVVPPSGRVMAGQRPPAIVARTVYHGGYEGLADAWGEFEGWIASAGHVSATELWEVYLAGPETSSDPASFRTQLDRPLIR